MSQRDISLGALLMIIGLMKAIFVMVWAIGGGGRYGGLLVLTLTIGLFFGALLMFSQLSPRQRGLTLGATIVFLGILVGVAVGITGGKEAALLAIVGISLLVSLFWVRLSNAFMRLFFDKELARESVNQAPLQPVPRPADTAQMKNNEPVELIPEEIKAKEPVQPYSVTEDATSLLNK
jgi:hypothetical protein